jgi:ABC-2 type transport system ATP-binding protein
MNESVLNVTNLKKVFGTFTAVDGISFSVGEGEIVGLLGPNGAGKTTTIQMLLSLMIPTSGSIDFFGMSLFAHREEILQRINTSSGYARLPWRLTVWENLNVYAHLYHVAKPKEKIASLAARFEATDLLPQTFRDLSAGQMTRVLLIKSLLNDPELLLLDEPTASLDPDIAEKIREYILGERQRRGLSILITSHNMTEVEEMCDRVVFLNHGKVLAVDTPEGLAKRNTQAEVSLMVKDGLKRLIERLQKEHYAYEEKNRFISISLPERQIAFFLTEIGKQGIEYNEIDINRPSLEDFFLSASKGII